MKRTKTLSVEEFSKLDLVQMDKYLSNLERNWVKSMKSCNKWLSFSLISTIILIISNMFIDGVKYYSVILIIISIIMLVQNYYDNRSVFPLREQFLVNREKELEFLLNKSKDKDQE